MGVKGLHKATAVSFERAHLQRFAGMKVACDASSWLVKGGARHARDIYTCPDYDKNPWTEYAVHMVDLLKEHNIHPIIVFDGERHPLKQETSNARKASKVQARKDAERAESEGDVSRAISKWMQAFELTDDMVEHARQTLEGMGVECVQAKCEADQTMASMSLGKGAQHVDLIITEDSDMIAYSCPNVLFKLGHDGHGDLLQVTPDDRRSDDGHGDDGHGDDGHGDDGHGDDALTYPPKKRTRIDVDVRTLSDIQRALLCTFSGNDYISNVQRGWAVKKVYDVIRTCHSLDDAVDAFQKRGVSVSSEYKDRARQCIRIFQCPQHISQVDMAPDPKNNSSLSHGVENVENVEIVEIVV